MVKLRNKYVVPAVDEELLPDIGYAIYRECTPSWCITSQLRFPLWDITYVLEGQAEYVINDERHTLAKGDLLCVPKQSLRQAHSFPDNLMHCYAVNFQLKNLQGNDAMLPFAIVSHIGDNPELVHLFGLLTSAWKAQRPGYRLECRGLLMLILHRLFEVIVYNSTDLTTADYRIRRVLRYIAQHYTENITVRKMTTMTELSARYLGALFKRTTGVSLKHYLEQTRIKNAEIMLRSGKYKVAEVARRCGYKDIFYFYKQFKEITGLTLSQFMPKK